MPYSVINVCGSFSISFHLHLHCCVIKIYGCMQKEFPIKTTIQKGTVYEKLHHHLFKLSHCYVFISFYIIDNRIITSFNQKKKCCGLWFTMTSWSDRLQEENKCWKIPSSEWILQDQQLFMCDLWHIENLSQLLDLFIFLENFLMHCLNNANFICLWLPRYICLSKWYSLIMCTHLKYLTAFSYYLYIDACKVVI